MKTTPHMPLNRSRRRFVLTALLGLLSAGGPAGCGTALNRARVSGHPPRWLSTLFDDRPAAARFGQDYLRAHPEERDMDALLHAVDEALTRQGGAAWVEGDRQQVARALAGLIRDEYRQGRIVQVIGWYLSHTEARLYAMAALL